MYEISVDVWSNSEPKRPINITFCGVDLLPLKDATQLLTTRLCEINGYNNGVYPVDINISKDGVFYDHDEAEIHMPEGILEVR